MRGIRSSARTNLTKARKTREATGSIVDILPGARGLTQDQWHKIKNRRQRLVLCRLMIDLMRGVCILQRALWYAPRDFLYRLMRGPRPYGWQAVFGRQNNSVYACPTQHCHTQARSIAALGLNLSSGPSILPARQSAQFIYRRAKLPNIAPASEQGHRGIDHFAHFAGLTASVQMKQSIDRRLAAARDAL